MRNFRFCKNGKFFLCVSLAIILAALVCLIANGFSLGLDFTGGSMITFNFAQAFEEEDIRTAFTENGVSEIQITVGGDANAEERTVALVRMATLSDADEETQKRIDITNKLKEKYPEVTMEVERVSGSASSEMISNALLSVVIAGLLMLVYIWVRFQLVTGISAVLALIHDVLIMMSIMLIFNYTINSSFIAAVLTILGYSINNTIIIFDRVRENTKRLSAKEYSFEDTVDKSIVETLTRTVNTSVTTLLTIVTLYIMGVTAIKEFCLPIIAGLLGGTYSSVFLAGPIWYWISKSRIFTKKAVGKQKKSPVTGKAAR